MVKLTIDENIGYADVEVEEDNKKSFKYLSIQKLTEIFLIEYKFDTGILPTNTIRYQKISTGIKISLISNQQVVNVKYEHKESDEKEKPVSEFKIPVPHLLWIFILDKDNKLIDTHAFAVKNLIINGNTMLYYAPFTNVFHDGRICWGNIQFKNKINLIGLPSLTRFFFTLKFNRDLDIEEKGIKCLEFFKSYNNTEQFPYEILKEYRIFKEVWNGL